MKKIEINEDDFKKIMLILKHSRPFVQLDPKDLFLSNLWRVSNKLADSITKKAGYEFTDLKGKKSLKVVNETTSDNEESEEETFAKVPRNRVRKNKL